MLEQAAHAPFEQPVSHAKTHVASEFDSHGDLATEYICQGAIVRACGISREQIEADVSRWRDAATILAHSLGFDGELDAVQKQRVYQYYLPIFFWTLRQLQTHQQEGHSRPLVVGISAPQGCGKSTIVAELVKLYAEFGLRCASVSIDDFYLSNAQQQAVCAQHPGNRLLQGRGNAGTHDVALGADTLRRLRELKSGERMPLPRYDKSAFGGAGDTAAHDAWPSVTGPLDIVLFEGWMLGFAPVGAESAGRHEAALAEVDDKLRGYEGAWDCHIDAWLVMKMADPRWVHTWRLQAERKMKAAGSPGMSDDEVAAFVDRYMPAYRAYLPGLYEKGPTTGKDGKTLFVEVDEQRRLLAAEAR